MTKFFLNKGKNTPDEDEDLELKMKSRTKN